MNHNTAFRVFPNLTPAECAEVDEMLTDLTFGQRAIRHMTDAVALLCFLSDSEIIRVSQALNVLAQNERDEDRDALNAMADAVLTMKDNPKYN